MKIAVLIRNFDINAGGAERYCVELTKRLSKIHEVHVFSQRICHQSDDIVFHTIAQWFEKPRYLNYLLFSYFTRRATKDKFDIVHSHEMTTHANIHTLHLPCFKTKWTQSKGINKLFRWLGVLISLRKIGYLWLEYKQMQVQPNKHFICVSEYLSKNLILNYPHLSKHLTMAYPGINHSKNDDSQKTCRNNTLIKQLGLSDNDFLLLFVGHDLVKKGLPTIIQALGVLNNNRAHVVVAGNGNSNKVNIPTILQNNVHFLGIVEDMFNLYQNVDVLIHPTLVDTYGMAVLEAMSTKLPVIVSNKKYCGFSEHLNDDQALILDNPKDEIELSKKINLLLSDVELKESIAKEGYKKSQSINWEETLEKTLLAYNTVLKNKTNILQINTEKTWRGGERQTLYTIEGLRKKNIRCTLMALSDTPLHKKALDAKIDVIAVNGYLDTLIKLAKVRTRFSIIHAQSAKAHTQSVLVKIFHRLPIIYTRRVDFVPKGFFTKIKYKLTNKIVSISSAISSILEQTKICTNSIVISSAVKNRKLNHTRAVKLKKSLNISSDIKIIGIVSALSEHKDPITALNTIHNLKHIRQDFAVLHFGDGHMFEQIHQEIKKLGLSKCYFQMGHHEDVEDYFSIMDVFLMTSNEEGLGSSVLDAFNYEVSVVSTNAGGLNDLVQDRGFLCNIGDTQCLSQGLSLALDSSKESTEYKVSAKEYCDNEMGIDLMTSKYVDLYKSIV